MLYNNIILFVPVNIQLSGDQETRSANEIIDKNTIYVRIVKLLNHSSMLDIGQHN